MVCGGEAKCKRPSKARGIEERDTLRVRRTKKGNDDGFEAGVKQNPGLWKSTARDANILHPFRALLYVRYLWILQDLLLIIYG